MHRIPAYLILFLYLGISSNVLIAQSDLPAQKIAEWNRQYPEEITYIHVDREVYNPGDTLWFKAYIRDKVMLKQDIISKSVFLKLLNASGHVVHHSIFPVFDSEAGGQLALDEDLDNGLYQLVFYSSWMKNLEYGELGRKTIRIRPESTGKEEFRVNLDRRQYFIGDTIKGRVAFLNRYKSELPDIRIEGSVGLKESRIRLSLKTPNENQFRLVVDRDLLKKPELELKVNYQGLIRDTLIHLPVPNHFRLSFFPEGGELVEGLSGRVAFTAHSDHGMRFEVEGSLYSTAEGRLGSVGTDHQGMGAFTLLPAKGERYYVLLEEPATVGDTFYLPGAKEKGWALQAAANNGRIQVITSHNYGDEREALVTVAVRGFMMNYIVRKVSGFDTFSVPTAGMPNGIAVVTLFDGEGNPRAERMVFIGRDKLASAGLETSKSSYLPRDRVSLKLKLSDPAGQPLSGSFSVAVTDEQLCRSRVLEEPGIVSSLYLGPEIKGHVKDPDYYFSGPDPQKDYHLDLLLLTQGWRRYRYEEILSAESAPMVPYRMYDVVDGQLLRYRYGGKGVPAKGIITVYNAGGSASFETDENGRFHYMHNYDPGINPNVVLFSEPASGKGQAEIILDPDLFEEGFAGYFRSMIDSIFYLPYDHPEPQVDFQDQYTLGINNEWIDEVIVYGRSRKNFEFIEETFSSTLTVPRDALESSLTVYGALLNSGYLVEERHTDAFPYIRLQWMLPPYMDSPIHFYVDDFPQDYGYVRSLLTNDIRALYVVRFPDTQMYEIPDRTLFMSGQGEGGGSETAYVIISLYLNEVSLGYREDERRNSVILPKLTMPKEFYKPQYDTEALRYSQVPDLRKTIHWEPDVVLDENGEAEITFYNGDRYTRISCILEGISDDGLPVRGECGYNVYTVRE